MFILTNSRMNQFSYKEWSDWFATNHEHRLVIDFSKEKDLSKEQRKLIFPSIRAFQKGEGSDGKHLLKVVETYVQKNNVLDYQKAMQWFVKEENWHSAYLKKYMNFHHVKVSKKSFLDHVFRRLRQLGGLKCEVTVLVTAEMIALTYYDALSKCTDSLALKSICQQMLYDELPHIMFQSYTLSHFKNNIIDKMARVIIMEITLLFVWGAFHRVYLAGGYSLKKYFRENLGYLRQSISLAER